MSDRGHVWTLGRVSLPQPAVCSAGLHRLPQDEGELLSHSGREVVPIDGEEAGTQRNLLRQLLKLYFSPEEIPTACADITASSGCMMLTSQIQIGIFW